MFRLLNNLLSLPEAQYEPNIEPGPEPESESGLTHLQRKMNARQTQAETRRSKSTLLPAYTTLLIRHKSKNKKPNDDFPSSASKLVTVSAKTAPSPDPQPPAQQRRPNWEKNRLAKELRKLKRDAKKQETEKAEQDRPNKMKTDIQAELQADPA